MVPVATWRRLVEAVHRAGKDAVLEGHAAISQLDSTVATRWRTRSSKTGLLRRPPDGWCPSWRARVDTAAAGACVGVVEVEVLHSDVLVHGPSPASM